MAPVHFDDSFSVVKEANSLDKPVKKGEKCQVKERSKVFDGYVMEIGELTGSVQCSLVSTVCVFFITIIIR